MNSTPIDLEEYEGRENRTTDLSIFHTYLNGKEAAWSLISNPYAYGQMVFLIPPGDLYTSLEKMLAPFETEVWIGIAATLTIGFVIIQVINFYDSKVQKFVFGRTITTPKNESSLNFS